MNASKSPEQSNTLAATAQDIQHMTAPLLDRAADQASALAQRGIDAVREGSRQVRESTQRASDSTVNYIQQEPLKAVLIAAATGAALIGLVSLLTRSHGRG